MNPIKVFIADDHPVVIDGLQGIFSQYTPKISTESPIEVIGTALNANDLLQNGNDKEVDVFVIDLGFESTKGDISIIEMLIELNASAKIVIYSMRKNINTIAGCYKAGAMAYVNKGDKTSELIRAVNTVARNEDYFVGDTLKSIGLSNIRDPLAGLSYREQKIFTMLAGNIDIGAVEKELGITKKTIENIITMKIKPVLGVSRTGFRDLAMRMNLIDDID